LAPPAREGKGKPMCIFNIKEKDNQAKNQKGSSKRRGGKEDLV